MTHANVLFCRQCLLIGAANSNLLRGRFGSLGLPFRMITHPDTTSETALSELFSNSSPNRYMQGQTLFLECFVNDVILSRHNASLAGNYLRAFSLLCSFLRSSRIYKKVVLIDLWPALLKSDSLAAYATQIARERNQVLAGLGSVVEFEVVELGRHTSSLTNQVDLFHFNELGLDSLEACLRERLPSQVDASHGLSVSDRARGQRLQAKLPILYLNASQIAPLSPPDLSLIHI